MAYKNITKKILLALAVFIITAVGQVLIGSSNNRAFALVGDIGATLPNNGSPATPWMVVTRQGTNGMDAPNSTASLYIPASATTATFTVEDACDNTANDSNPANNDTYFWLYADEITSISTSSPGTVVAGPIAGWWSDYLFRCDTGTSSTITVGINTSKPPITINGQQLRRLRTLTATDASKTSYYVNRYRINISATANSYVSLTSFTPTEIKPVPNTATDYTGIAYPDAPRGWGWSTRVNFAYRCTVSANVISASRRVYFYDTDYHASEVINPWWQTPSHLMTYSIEKYNRYNSAFAGYAYSGATQLVNQPLYGGLDIDDSTLPFVMDPSYIYSIVISGINYVNSIQMALESPATQIDALDRCGGSAPSLSCSVIGASIEPGDYTPQVSVSYSALSGFTSATFNTTVIVNGVSRTVNGTVLAPGGSTTISGFSPPYNLGGGTYSISASVSGSAGALPLSATCGGATTISVVAKPYFKVFDGGAMVGAGFNSGTTTCTTMGSGQVSAFASNSPSLHGASTQYDLRALGAVATTFYSFGDQPTALPNYKALTFANNAASGTYGGSFGGTSCITDYYTTTKNATVPTASGASTIASLDAAAGVNNQVEWGGGTLSGGSLAAGGKLVVYVNGDVYISSNITMATNYNSLTDIPFFALVVKGNIKIAPGVTQLDGLYVAQPNGASGGTIYTCINADNTIPNLYNSCRTKLRFNGSVVAKNIKLLRTAGTLASGTDNERAGSANIAEVFNGMPEMYIAYPAFRVDDSTTELYDSITSLPPLL